MVATAQLGSDAVGHPGLVAGLYWLAVFFAGLLAVDRSMATEREENSWEALFSYPLSPATVYWAKVAANTLALAALQVILLPLFVALSGVPMLAHPAAMILVAFLGALGIAALGTLLSAVSAGLRQTAGLLGLLLLPLLVPVILSAVEATRLLAVGELGPDWWRSVQFLGAFAVIFLTAGTVLFEFAIED
jgi:heme exporter protein B